MPLDLHAEYGPEETSKRLSGIEPVSELQSQFTAYQCRACHDQSQFALGDGDRHPGVRSKQTLKGSWELAHGGKPSTSGCGLPMREGGFRASTSGFKWGPAECHQDSDVANVLARVVDSTTWPAQFAEAVLRRLGSTVITWRLGRRCCRAGRDDRLIGGTIRPTGRTAVVPY
jgi:hypothetical protein